MGKINRKVRSNARACPSRFSHLRPISLLISLQVSLLISLLISLLYEILHIGVSDKYIDRRSLYEIIRAKIRLEKQTG